MATTTKKQKQQRIRIRLQAYDHRLLDTSAARLVDVASQSGCKVVGPIPLPTHRQVFCVLRSPHADKKSREHFEVRTMEQLSRVDMPAGVDIEVKL